MPADYRDTARKWYKSKRWARIRQRQLSKHPYCQCPHHDGDKLPADHPEFGGAVVDHIRPHRGDARLFWDTSNLASMTKQCHDSGKSSQERGGHGFLRGCNADGEPLSKDHPWYDRRDDAV